MKPMKNPPKGGAGWMYKPWRDLGNEGWGTDKTERGARVVTVTPKRAFKARVFRADELVGAVDAA